MTKKLDPNTLEYIAYVKKQQALNVMHLLHFAEPDCASALSDQDLKQFQYELTCWLGAIAFAMEERPAFKTSKAKS